MHNSRPTSSASLPAADFELTFHRDASVEQGEERFEVRLDGQRLDLRFHDYAQIFSIPGLYEELFHDHLECRSPQTVCGLLAEQFPNGEAEELRVLDVGAGNGLVAEEMANLGADPIVGVDIIPEAAEAAERDRPELYDAYHVVDLTDIPDDTRSELEDQDFNCMTSVAALGFGDIPPRAFAEAYNLVANEGWIAFNIKDDFLGAADSTGFSKLMSRMVDEGVIEVRGQERYRHRLSVAGEPLHYVAMVGRKQDEIPAAWPSEATG